MRELVTNAVNGWSAYRAQGKYAVLLMGLLLYFWYLKAVRREGGRSYGRIIRRQELLVEYATLTVLAAVFPVTAAMLMIYQTRFYDYEWIWSVVPLTLMIAYGATAFFLEYCRKNWSGKLLKPAALLTCLLAVLVLCGNLGYSGWDGQEYAVGEKKAAVLLDKLSETGNTEDICLWAPKEILTHVRGIDGSVRLLYGRNMWEEALNAYSYDVYSQETVALYEWMEQLAKSCSMEEGISQEQISAALTCVETALDHGMNCILVPEQAESFITPILKKAAQTAGCDVDGQSAEGYQIYRLLP